MTDSYQVSTWDPLHYFSTQELARLDERFDSVLRDETYLVFWTGLSPKIAKRWAEQHGLQTLVIAMGPLYSDGDVGSARYGKSLKGWTKYMKGASGRFAEYTCRGGRGAIVLTNPPPNIYSTRENSNYRSLEEPILKGVFGGPVAVQINYVHPTINGAAAFQYQMWPLNKSKEWIMFLKNLFPQGYTACDIPDKSAKDEAISGTEMKQSVVQNQHDIQSLACEKHGKCQKKKVEQKKAEQQAQERKQAKVKKKEARRKTAEQQAQERKEAKVKEKEARRKKAELQQQQARARKEANRKRAEKARAIKQARRLKMELDRQEARKRKEAKQRKRNLNFCDVLNQSVEVFSLYGARFALRTFFILTFLADHILSFFTMR